MFNFIQALIPRPSRIQVWCPRVGFANRWPEVPLFHIRHLPRSTDRVPLAIVLTECRLNGGDCFWAHLFLCARMQNQKCVDFSPTIVFRLDTKKTHQCGSSKPNFSTPFPFSNSPGSFNARQQVPL